MYPNPNNGIFKIQFQAEESSTYTLRIVNLSGAELYRTTGLSVEGANDLNVNLPGLSTGFYFAELVNGSEKQIEKIILGK